MEYDHTKIENKWQKQWKEAGTYKISDDTTKPKCYVLDMFPYPSGEGLHVGHPKGYIATDIYSRFKKMNGYNVLHPMGWDAFGLPAENYAIRNKIHPGISVEKNIKRYKEQLSILGFNYDWSREINTTDPDYYHWTQWVFIQMFKKGLAFESNEPINWCPSCQTGLANEDLEDGKCERCGSTVEKKPMRQWVLKITDYADRLLSDLDDLNWPESIKESQRNWIGKTEGAEIDFPIEFAAKQKPGLIPVFTTRPDTLFGVTALVFSPEHVWVTLVLDENHKDVLKNTDDVRRYVEQAKKKTEIDRTNDKNEKTGVKLDGVWAVNPATKENIPVFVADYVISSYGTGAVMSVPAHDERDFVFSKKFNIPVKQVIAPFFIDKDNLPQEGKKWSPRKNVMAIVKHPTEDKIIQIRWKKVPWRTFVIGGVEGGETYDQAVVREVREETGYKNFKKVEKLGWQMESHFYASHKDINRQAFPQVFIVELADLEKENLTNEESQIHDVVWVPTSEIKTTFKPVSELQEILAHLEKGLHAFVGTGKIINSGKFDGIDSEEAKSQIVSFVGGRMVTTYKLRDWVFSRQRYWGEPIPLIHCKKCGVVSVHENDLPVKLPDVQNYAPTGTGESPLAEIEDWVNVKCPKCNGNGRRETNTMPQWAGSCWYYLRYMDPKNKMRLVDPEKEKYWAPVDVYVGGAEHATRHLIYARFWHKFLYDIGLVSSSEPFVRLHNVGLILSQDGRKMSKRFGNVVNPDDIVRLYGADTFRIHEMFMGPFGQSSSWDTKSIIGSRRFIDRVWRLAQKVNTEFTHPDGETRKKFEQILNSTISKVTNDMETFSFNTAVSALMILSRELENMSQISKDDFLIFLRLLSPLAPHVTEELWYMLEQDDSIHKSQWPKIDISKIIKDEVTIMVQINGKIRGELNIPLDSSQDDALDRVMALETLKRWLIDQKIKKVVFIKNRLINIVLG